MNAVAGLGFRQQASPEALRQVLDEVLRAAEIFLKQPVSLQALATAEDKCSHAAFVQLAAQLALPVQAVPLSLLRAQVDARPTDWTPVRYGSKSLAEAAALAAAGRGSALAAQRHISADGCATAAIAFQLSDSLPT